MIPSLYDCTCNDRNTMDSRASSIGTFCDNCGGLVKRK